MLSWSLCICTLDRPDFLLKTLQHALIQTRQPAEIIVVDASHNWEENRVQILSELD